MTIERAGVKAASLKVKVDGIQKSQSTSDNQYQTPALLTAPEFDTLIMDSLMGDPETTAAYPSPFTASMFDCPEGWRFEVPPTNVDQDCSFFDETSEADKKPLMTLEVMDMKEEVVEDESWRARTGNKCGMTSAYEDMFQSASSHISQTCQQLGISANVTEWTKEEVQEWCNWVLQLFNVASHHSYTDSLLSVDGRTLASFTKSDFESLLPHVGEYVYSELELWKTVHCLLASKMDWNDRLAATSQQQTTAIVAGSSEYTQLLTAAGLSCSSWPTQVTYTSSGSCVQSESSLTRPSSLQIPQSVLEANLSTPTKTTLLHGSTDPVLFTTAGIPSADYGCYDDASPASSYHDYGAESRSTYTSSSPRSYDSPCYGESTDMKKSFSTISGSSCSLSDSSCGSSGSSVGGKQSNHLWQFLKELLLQPQLYHNSIRWLDHSQGIFKIEDSSHVAKLWGQRKNRPAMNYDKLSRSIRQYYKKGIIKKTSHSKRLVYQFCSMYL